MSILKTLALPLLCPKTLRGQHDCSLAYPTDLEEEICYLTLHEHKTLTTEKETCDAQLLSMTTDKETCNGNLALMTAKQKECRGNLVSMTAKQKECNGNLVSITTLHQNLLLQTSAPKPCQPHVVSGAISGKSWNPTWYVHNACLPLGPENSQKYFCEKQHDGSFLPFKQVYSAILCNPENVIGSPMQRTAAAGWSCECQENV